MDKERQGDVHEKEGGTTFQPNMSHKKRFKKLTSQKTGIPLSY